MKRSGKKWVRVKYWLFAIFRTLANVGNTHKSRIYSSATGECVWRGKCRRARRKKLNNYSHCFIPSLQEQPWRQIARIEEGCGNNYENWEYLIHNNSQRDRHFVCVFVYVWVGKILPIQPNAGAVTNVALKVSTAQMCWFCPRMCMVGAPLIRIG